MFQDLPLVKNSDASPGSDGSALNKNRVAMLPPPRAWQILCQRTGGRVSLVTFYRWLRSGKIYSIRLGQRIFIPVMALEDTIKQCLDGERF
jgi:hypothetical protein